MRFLFDCFGSLFWRLEGTPMIVVDLERKEGNFKEKKLLETEFICSVVDLLMGLA